MPLTSTLYNDLHTISRDDRAAIDPNPAQHSIAQSRGASRFVPQNGGRRFQLFSILHSEAASTDQTGLRQLFIGSEFRDTTFNIPHASNHCARYTT
ncbi:hypothetical protein TgHK011_004591 [Trichoderma gracile]|nr:hypothetical protein TgHK011_004591 [Trichoderma gracile]